MGRSGAGNALIREVALPAAIALLLLAAIVAAILHFSTIQTDQLAAERQNRRVTIALEQSVIAIANDQEASTYWDDAVVQTRKRPLDLEWIDNNLGIWFHTYYHVDEAYLLDQHDTPIYAMRDGRRDQPASFQRAAGPALELARRLRAEIKVARFKPDGADGRTVGTFEFAEIGGHPALVSLKPILSETGEVRQPPGSEYIHVAVRYLDGSFLARLARTYGIDAPRFSRTEPRTISFPLLRPDGRIVGYIAWTPFEPGAQVEAKMVPVLIVVFFGVGALLGLLLLRIRRGRMELETSRAQAQHLALHDSLTGLPNRALFEDRLELALTRRGAKVAVLMLDLDRFKAVNDTLGHPAGDALIRQFGERLTALTREYDTIARLGGDEFAILVESAELADIRRLAKRILADIRRPFELSGSQVYVGVSIGIALTSQVGVERLELVRRADIALYRAKDCGRDSYRLFSPEMDDGVKLRSTIEDELRQAVATGTGLRLHYQPVIGEDGAIVGVEALVRWQHMQRGLTAANEFISVAEETGLIVPLGDWVLREACLQSRRWPNLFVAVNLSPVQLRSPALYDRVMRTVQLTRADPGRIQLEVTERALLDEDDMVRSTLAKLRAAGFKIALDNFGTGHSSLSSLRKFEVDKIKIDGSFIQHLGNTTDSAAIVTAVLALGHAMALTVSADGVESAEQRAFLRTAGCREMQGYYFSRPLPAEQIAPLLGVELLSSAA
jgi:diguanylate cyclase (GGDEF)-like protein